jgi:hypothetical protein
MKIHHLIAIGVLAACLVASGNQLGAATLYVAQSSPNPTPPYTTRETAAHTIQDAVDAATDGDIVLVAPGEYWLMNQISISKAIAVRSESGPGQTSLDGQYITRCLLMFHPLAVVDGFTVRSGRAPDGAVLADGVVMIGGVLSNCVVKRNSSPSQESRLVHCSSGGLITDCYIGPNNGFANKGAGVYLTDSELRDSTISGMLHAPAYGGADDGAGVYAVSSIILGCVISNNYARRAGGGAYLDGCVVDQCIITGNRAGVYLMTAGQGGGIFALNSVVRNSLISMNVVDAGYDALTGTDGGLPGFGGGVYFRGGGLLNCTITGNRIVPSRGTEPPKGGGIYVESGNVRNSIIYFNSAASGANWYWNDPLFPIQQLQLVAQAPFTYSCTTPDPGGTGLGNIVEGPQFVDQTNGDYRLQGTSPCIDAGANEPWMSGAQDLDGNPRIASGTVDLGAWERLPVPVVTWIAPTSESGFPAGNDIRMSVRATDPDGSVSFVEFFANSMNLARIVSGTDVYDFVWSNAPSGSFRLHAEAVDDAGGRGSSDSVLIVVGATEPVAALSNPGPAAGDNAGHAVAISGSRLIIGAPLDDTGARNAGSTYVYDLASATPTVPVATLNNPSPAVDESFGWSVAAFDTLVVVGAREGGGVAYIYDLDSATPSVPVATLKNPNQEYSDWFGYSVAVSGTRVVVGVPYAGQYVSSGSYPWWLRATGKAYVYDLASVTPTAPIATLTNPSPALDDFFGYSVVISGTRVIVGAYGDDTGADNAGTAYVYDLASAGPAVPVATLNSPSPATNEFFGSALALSDARVVVGAYGAGGAYVYDLSSTTPSEPILTLNNPNQPGNASNYFASSVAISGDRVVVGAYHHEVDSTGAPGAGSTYVYDLASATPTVPVATLHNPSPSVNDRFGYSVGVSGTRVLVGAPNDDSGATDAGSAYLYEFADGTTSNAVGFSRHLARHRDLKLVRAATRTRSVPGKGKKYENTIP